VVLAAPLAAPALAAGSQRGASTAPPRVTGNDISFPQCGGAFPVRPAFGIVGVNGGLANDLNPCLGPSSAQPSYRRAELYWAVAASTGVSSQPKASLYVDTGDPGNHDSGRPIADWPKAGATPYGACTTVRIKIRKRTFTVGRNSGACAWEYGYKKAAQDVAWVSGAAKAIDRQKPAVTVSAAARSYRWWLDVEQTSTWQSGGTGKGMNVADLQGMIAALRRFGASAVGAYSTSLQWTAITGVTRPSSGSLYRMPDWIPGATTVRGAKSDCHLRSFTAGRVVITQFHRLANPDGDYAC
jgi:hypothetical protein